VARNGTFSFAQHGGAHQARRLNVPWRTARAFRRTSAGDKHNSSVKASAAVAICSASGVNAGWACDNTLSLGGTGVSSSTERSPRASLPERQTHLRDSGVRFSSGAAGWQQTRGGGGRLPRCGALAAAGVARQLARGICSHALSRLSTHFYISWQPDALLAQRGAWRDAAQRLRSAAPACVSADGEAAGTSAPLVCRGIVGDGIRE